MMISKGYSADFGGSFNAHIVNDDQIGLEVFAQEPLMGLINGIEEKG